MVAPCDAWQGIFNARQYRHAKTLLLLKGDKENAVLLPVKPISNY